MKLIKLLAKIQLIKATAMVVAVLDVLNLSIFLSTID